MSNFFFGHYFNTANTPDFYTPLPGTVHNRTGSPIKNVQHDCGYQLVAIVVGRHDLPSVMGLTNFVFIELSSALGN